MNPLKKSYKLFKKTCSPAQLYFILGLIAMVASLRFTYNLNSILVSGILLVLWTFVLNMFCNWGWSNFSWFLVLFPYVLLLLVIFLLPFGKDKKRNKKRNKEQNTPEKKEQNNSQNKKQQGIKAFDSGMNNSIQHSLIKTHRMVHNFDKHNLQ